MRIFRCYYFEFPKADRRRDLFERVERFLEENALHAGALKYRFETLLSQHQQIDFSAKAAADFPTLQPAEDYHAHNSDYSVTSNCDRSWAQIGFTDCRDALRAIVKKIPRTYGFLSAEVRFSGIDFFGRTLPEVSPDSGTFPEVWRENWRTTLEARIVLYRHAWPGGPFDASAWIDVTPETGGEPLDDGDCLSAMEAALGARAVRSDDALHLDGAELAEIEAADALCDPTLVATDKAFQFWEGCPEPLQYHTLDDCRDNKYSLAKPLRAVLERLGYGYVEYDNWSYYFEKFNDRRHSIWVEVNTAPMCRRIDAVVHYRGLGFDHVFGVPSFTPHDQKQAQRYVDSLATTLELVEKQYFPVLRETYPPCPTWVRMTSKR